MGEKGRKTPSSESKVSGESLEQRRSAVRKILGASSVAAGVGASKWMTPKIESVILPAHAQATGGGGGEGGDIVVLRGQIGEPDSFGLLDLFLSPAYAIEDDLVGGCIEITVNGSSVTAAVTLNTGASDSNSGALTECGFTVTPVHGYTVTGSVDDPDNPTTSDGSVGSESFSAVVNGFCSVTPPSTTTTTTSTCDPASGTCDPD